LRKCLAPPSLSRSPVAIRDLSGFPFFQPVTSSIPGLRSAKAAASKAIELDEKLGEAYGTLAIMRLVYDWDWAAADRECQRAFELNPNDPTVLLLRGLYLLSLGRFDECFAAGKRARELDPVSPISPGLVFLPSLCAHKYEEAIQASKVSLEMVPNNLRFNEFLAFACALQGRYEEAIAACERIRSLPGGGVRGRALLGYCYALAGRTAEARSIFEELKKRPEKDLFVLHNTAVLCAALHEFDGAFELLNQLCDEHFAPLFYLKQQPWFEPLHSDPRFGELLRRIGVPSEPGA